MTYDSVMDCVGSTPLVRLRRCFPHSETEVLAKLEMLNPCGSMKDRPARYIVEQGVCEGTLVPGMRLVESTSGNLGVALASAARMHGLSFTAVVDPNTSPTNLRLLELFGADVDMVTEPDEAGGYLHTRVHRAPVSTTGSRQGTARRLREANPDLRVVAVDAVGSVIFGTPPAKRRIPGFGASRVPEIFNPEEVDDVIHVADPGSTAGCRRLVETEGILAGGSSGAVITALDELLDRLPGPARVVTWLPDRGERYLDTIYDDTWAENLKCHASRAELVEAP